MQLRSVSPRALFYATSTVHIVIRSKSSVSTVIKPKHKPEEQKERKKMLAQATQPINVVNKLLSIMFQAV